jgi:glycosyltransferase involved in cell wall biosynthesis
VVEITDKYYFDRNKNQVIAFAPLGQLKFGTSIRTTYLLGGLDSRGLLIGQYEKPLVSKHIVSDKEKIFSLFNLYKLPSLLKRADTVFFEGLPSASNTIRTKFLLKILTHCKRRGKHIILDLYDDPELQIRDIIGEHATPHGWSNVRREFFESSNIVTFPSESMKDYYVKMNQIDEEKAKVIPNASDPNHFQGLPLPNVMKIGVLSGIGHGRGLDLLLDSFDIIKNEIKDTELWLGCRAVTKSDKNFLASVSNKYKDGKVLIRSDVTYLTAPKFLRECSICVIPHRKSFYMDIATPVKLFDYMAAGRPIVTTDCKESAKIVRTEMCGLVSGFSTQELSQSIITLLKDRRALESYGARGRKAIEKSHSWEHRVEKLIRIITSL